MTAEVLPFPSHRRSSYIARQAARMLSDPEERSRQRCLAHQLEVQAKTMARKGITSDRVARDLAGLAAAIELAVTQLQSQQGDVA